MHELEIGFAPQSPSLQQTCSIKPRFTTTASTVVLKAPFVRFCVHLACVLLKHFNSVF